ncbi:MAG: peptidoglycan-binding domain-containing protein [Stagnimonas sp.]|nr:peptidoglycan-binding domain-containing protein [Stagnimonas sp.]
MGFRAGGLAALTVLMLVPPALAQSSRPGSSDYERAVYGGPGFPALSSGEFEQKRTAELLAQTQLRGRAPAAGSLARLEPGLLVTRRDSSPVEPHPRSAAIPPPAPGYLPAAMGSHSIPPMPDARPGECFALVKLPEQYRSYQQEYELRAAGERIETTPPRYEMVSEQYVVREAYERMEVVPASFRTITEPVELTPPSVQYQSTEPLYETVTEQVLEQPARTVWKRGSGPIQRIDNATGEIMCLVEEPAVYKSVSRRVLRAPAELREIAVPGQTALVSKQVIDRPAEVRRVVVPEQLGTRTVRRLVAPGTARRVPIPAQLGSTTVRELVEPSRLEWRAVLCQTNMTPDVIGRVQTALVRQGYNPGPVNGRLGAETIAALNQYQRARQLPVDQYLNMETVRSLGVM